MVRQEKGSVRKEKWGNDKRKAAPLSNTVLVVIILHFCVVPFLPPCGWKKSPFHSVRKLQA